MDMFLSTSIFSSPLILLNILSLVYFKSIRSSCVIDPVAISDDITFLTSISLKPDKVVAASLKFSSFHSNCI